MSMLLPIWKAHLKSAYNALRTDARTRVTWLIALVIDFGLGAWSVNVLIARLSQWHAAGTAALTGGLWLLCLAGWAGISLFTILSTLQLGFASAGIGSVSSLLLMTLPIPVATRFRALYGLMFLEGIGNWLLLEIGIMGIALTVTLGWQSLTWLVLLLVGACVAVWCGMVSTLLVIRYVLPNIRRVVQVLLVGVAIVGVVVGGVGLKGVHLAGVGMAMASLATARAGSLGHTIPQMASFFAPTFHLFGVPLSAEVGSALFFVLLVVMVGPLAGPVGKLYVAAFHSMEGRAGRRSVLTLPGTRVIGELLGRYRNFTGALAYKGLLNQSRSPFTWARLVMVLVGLLLFPVIRNLVAHYEFSNMLMVVVYASGLAILAIIELAPYAISGEGSRLAWYLVAPLNIADIWRARLIVFLWSALCVGLIGCFILGWEVGLPVVELPFVIVIVVLIVIGYTMFVVWGSVFDEDLNLVVEGRMQTLFQEELPFTPRRMQLLGASLLLFALMLFLVWKLPVMLAIPALVLLNGAVLVGLGHFSRMHLLRLLRKG